MLRKAAADEIQLEGRRSSWWTALLPCCRAARKSSCALGLRERLVGVSHECDYPTDVVGLPVLTEPKLDPRGTSGDIDARVQEIVQEGLSVYRLNTDALQDLKAGRSSSRRTSARCAPFPCPTSKTRYSAF